MTQRRTCLACQGGLEPRWKYCFKCGARVDEELMQEARSIDFILGEIAHWHEQMLINHYVQQRLVNHYLDRKNRIVESILPSKIEPQPSIEPIATLEQPPVKTIKLEPDRVEIKHSPPPIRSDVPPVRDIQQQAVVVEKIESKRNFSELVAENIRTIFAICIALFVGGIVLYYRNEIYFGLKQPINQAVILALVTLGSLVSGWTLVRRTAENLAGRTLTLVGSLLVPVNPWFLVRSHLIPNTGNAWILGIACAALYGWTAFFLRERLYVYLSLATVMLSGCAAVYKFTGGSSASVYAVVLISFSILYLLAERFFKPGAEGVQFSREEYGKPFFHVAQVGVALSLLFYTPLIKLLPEEFVAVKQYFDPQSYNSLVTVWLALAGAFVYFYSSYTRRATYFVYLAIATILWSEGALLYYFDLNLPAAFLAFSITGLLMILISNSGRIEDFFSQPVGLVAELIGGLVCLGAIYGIVTIGSTDDPSVDWRILSSFLVASIIFSIELVKRRKRRNFYPAAILLNAALLFFLIKVALPGYLLGVVMLASAYIALLLSNRDGDLWKSIRSDLQISALVITCSVIFSSSIGFWGLIEHTSILALLCVEIAGIFAVLSYFATDGLLKLVGFFIAGIFLTFSYSSLLLKLDNLGLDDEYSLAAFALWALLLYGISRIEFLQKEAKASLSFLSSVIAVIFFLASLVGVSVENLTRNSPLSISIVITLVILGFKEVKHLISSRSIFHSSFTSLIILLLAIVLLRISTVKFEIGLLWIVWLAIAYTGISQLLRKQVIERSIYTPIEVISNLITAICLLIAMLTLTQNSRLSLSSFLITFSITLFYSASAYLTGRSLLGKIYAHAASATLLASAAVLSNHLGVSNWSELSGVLIPILSIFLLLEKPLKETVFSGSVFLVAQVAMPIIIALGLWSGLSLQSTHLGSALFFSEIALFYLLSAFLKRKGEMLYPALPALGVALWQMLLHLNIGSGYFMAFYGILGFSLLLLSFKVEGSKFAWTRTVLFHFANLFLIFSAIGALIQSIASMSLFNNELNPLIGTLLVLIALGALSSALCKDPDLSRIYRRSTFALSCFLYFVIGVRLGYDIVRQAEFYSIPIGTALLLSGYISSRRSPNNTAAQLLWSGSLLWTAPLLLHTLQYRFITHEPSTLHDIGLLVISLGLILGGIMLQLKAPTIVGGSSFLIGMSVIVFGFVEWEQKWLSISMIVLAIAIFGSSWIIYFFHKRNKLGQLREQSRQVMEEFGKWK